MKRQPCYGPPGFRGEHATKDRISRGAFGRVDRDIGSAAKRSASHGATAGRPGKAEPIAIDHAAETSDGQQQAATAGQPQSQAPQTAISVQSNLVNIDAVVTDFDGNIIQGLQKQNFRVLDDGQPQQITNFAPSEAPITIVILMEFSKLLADISDTKRRTGRTDF